ncbi:hypothetical protein D3C87_2045000 [compost metagenome]
MLHIRIKSSPDHKFRLLLERFAGKGNAVVELLDHPDDLEGGQIVYRAGPR